MRKINPFLLPAAFVFALFMLISCEAFDALFKAGLWTGIFIIFSFISLIIYAVAYTYRSE